MRTLFFDDKPIRMTTDGFFAVSDVAKALGYTSAQWYTVYGKDPDAFEPHVRQERFVLKAPPVRVIDLEGLKLYLSRSTAGGTEKGEKLYRLLRDEAIHAGAEPGINEEAVEVLVQKAQAFLDALTTIEKSATSQYMELQQALERIREGRAA